MNTDLYELEKKILAFFNKQTNEGKSFSLLEVADKVDPRHKYNYNSFETIFRVLEINAVLYHNEDDSWCLFSNKENIVQGIVKKNEKGTVLVDTPDGKKYILNPSDAGYLLDKDIITFIPTKKTSGSRFISDLDKIVKRNNGLVVVSFKKLENGFELTPLTTKLSYPICIPEHELETLNNGDQLLVQIDELNYAGVLEAKVIKKMDNTTDKRFIEENLGNNEEYSDVEFSEESVKAKPTLRKKVAETIYDSQDVKTYIANAKRIRKELQLASNTVVGEIHINKYGDGFVEVDDKRYRIRREYLSDVFDGDIVEIRPSKLNSRGVINSIVEGVVERKNGLVIVEVGLGKDKEIFRRYEAATRNRTGIDQSSRDTHTR